MKAKRWKVSAQAFPEAEPLEGREKALSQLGHWMGGRRQRLIQQGGVAGGYLGLWAHLVHANILHILHV